MSAVTASICIATYNKPIHLDRVLQSIRRQSPPFDYELIVVDDAPADDAGRVVCQHYGVRYHRLEREHGYRNPAPARNMAYRLARGDVIICQSDDVEHRTDCIEQLVAALQPGTYAIATVDSVSMDGEPIGHPLRRSLTRYTGPDVRRPLFFLGALWRSDLYAVGGNDERFTSPGREDVWFADCLRYGLGLRGLYPAGIEAWHLDHPRPELREACGPSAVLYRELREATENGQIPWAAAGAPWSLDLDRQAD